MSAHFDSLKLSVYPYEPIRELAKIIRLKISEEAAHREVSSEQIVSELLAEILCKIAALEGSSESEGE